ncbi:MAG: hypothetical protein D6706_08350 [Chloroflexi bacterium]|nr:MAG: hypothetical protein D6706_08350 [Chloroflexota bacterium]
MKSVTLTARQKDLLRTLVALTQEGKLSDPIIPIPFGTPTQYAVYLRGAESFRFKHLSDLDALCDAGLLRFRWNRQGTGKLYTITQAGFTAVSTNFSLPPSPLGYDINLAELLQIMSGDRFPLNRLPEETELAALAHDPIARHTCIEVMCDELLRLVRPLLNWEAFAIYEKQTQILRSILLQARPDEERLKTAVRVLGFLEQTDIPLPDLIQVWAILYPLMLLGVARSQQNKLTTNNGKRMRE